VDVIMLAFRRKFPAFTRLKASLLGKWPLLYNTF
jgi:hypothetical protein